jgi:hypothetical protein
MLRGDGGHDGVDLSLTPKRRGTNKAIDVAGRKSLLRLCVEPTQFIPMVNEILGECLVNHLRTALSAQSSEHFKSAIVMGEDSHWLALRRHQLILL